MRTRRLLLAAAAALCASVAVAQTYKPGEETVDALPPGPGQEETFYACTACHGTALIKAQGMSRPQWDGTIGYMIERHNMPALPPEDRERIVAYLAQHYLPRAQAHGRGWQNPFLKR
jgi:hypothetical protein